MANRSLFLGKLLSEKNELSHQVRARQEISARSTCSFVLLSLTQHVIRLSHFLLSKARYLSPQDPFCSEIVLKASFIPKERCLMITFYGNMSCFRLATTRHFVLVRLDIDTNKRYLVVSKNYSRLHQGKPSLHRAQTAASSFSETEEYSLCETESTDPGTGKK